MKIICHLIIIFFFYGSCFSADAEGLMDHAGPKLDSLQGRLNNMMQHTASWLDSTAEQGGEKASAAGYLQLSWLPRTAEVDKVDAKFKVFFNLPQWNKRLALVIDNDDENERLLDYESDYTRVNQGTINVAFQYIKQFNKHYKIKNRVGLSRKQPYLRSQIDFDGQVGKASWNFQPRIDYFYKDGWGPSVKAIVDYRLVKHRFSVSASWQKIQAEKRSRRKVGLFHIMGAGNKQLLVNGVQYTQSNNKYDVLNQSYFISTRYRKLIYKSWMYFEIEPFVEFSELNDFRREVGVALSITSYYGK